MAFNLNDVFWTFQGEGYHAGRRALFIRMPHCNLKCSWCDTSFNTSMKWSESDLRAYAQQEPSRFAVITGGEPSMNKQTPEIVLFLKHLGFYVAMESNGTFDPPAHIDWLTLSPKRDAYFDVTYAAFLAVSEVKFVVDLGFDFKVVKQYENLPGIYKYLSPEYNSFYISLEFIYEYIRENPTWKVSLQTHKWMNIK